ncbi:FRG domain-containing protein [Aeromonas sobria]|uniref:FRG domain-containing protein n=1 Tax=Aeromonas sobria TaxID=646 RepID=UPI0026ED8517|nr:FRG domain-containing protein [Aeromonas sobria]
MYNLLVTSKIGAWENGYYVFDKSRFLEYTNERIALAFKDLTESNINKLKSYPCIFAYEGEELDFHLGYLTSIKERGRDLFVEFHLMPDIPPIPFQKIKEIAALLDIRDWEMNRTHWAVKDENLFDRLESNNVIEQKATSRTKKLERPTITKSTNPKVTTIKGFIEKVLDYTADKNTEIFYRGHSDNKYKLEPSIFRKDGSGNPLYLDNEHIIYRELLVSNSADFQSDVYTLDRLVRMQHFSLPTRLLDITSNPLIALYFACKSSQESEGEVILLSMNRSNVKYFDSDVASCLANLSRLPKLEKDSIDFSCDDFNFQSSIKQLLHFIKEEKSFFEPQIVPDDLRKIICVKGKKSNDRISSQSGAFLLFGIDAILDENGTQDISIFRITVSNKAEILTQLDKLNINESTVFPYIENSARYIAERFKFSTPNS